ncbi:MAG: hypothetical protein J6Q13_01555 [Clostridia bacterium]|nr:hypothetical protein [Clostridia bacterium]
MQEKTKNILKGLGVGTLACVGLFGLTGCSIDLSQEQVDKIMYTVDNSDKFMQETLDLLEKQNQELDKQQAFDTYNLAKTKVLLNYDNMYDNLKISLNSSKTGYTKHLKSFKTENGLKFMSFKDIEQHEIVYSDGDNSIEVKDFGEDDSYIKTVHEKSFGKFIAQSHYMSTIFEELDMMINEKEDVVKFEKMSDGKSQITFMSYTVIEEHTFTTIGKATINSDGLFEKVELTSAITASSDTSYISEPTKATLSIEYGNLIYDDIEEELTLAQNVVIEE